MAFSKAHLYRKRERRIARFANALAHPARITILNQLQNGEMEFAALLELHPINKATLSQHLRTLRLAGLIDFSLYGNISYYSLNYENQPKWVHLILVGMIRKEDKNEAA